MSTALQRLESALEHQRSGDHAAAQSVLRDLLREEPDNGDGLHLMGLSLHALGRDEEALDWIAQAIEHRNDEPIFLCNTGIVALGLGDLTRAARYLERAIAADPLYVDAYNNLALLREKEGQLEDALAFLEKATALRPEFPGALSNMGNVLRGLGRMSDAIDAYLRALEIEPGLAEAHNGLGNTYQLMRDFEAARRSFDRAIGIRPDYAEPHFNRAMTLAAQGDAAGAVGGIARALAIRPEARFRISSAGLLPVIPASRAEISKWRARFAESFRSLKAEGLMLDGTPLHAQAMSFYLAYHGENDRQMMEMLADFYLSACPALAVTAPHCEVTAEPRRDGPVRVGMLSRYFGEHAVAWMIEGLLAALPRDRYQVRALTVLSTDIPVSRRIEAAVDEVVALPYDLEGARQRISELELDILLYADIGMEAFSYFLAFARLAPVQCVIWGHPDTTGIPTIDYYLSNDIAEPPDAANAYSEKLVRLDGVQSRYPQVAKPFPLPGRVELGLPETGTIYLCPQNLIKIHPDMDESLAAILDRDPAGRLVIFHSLDPNWTRLLLARWAPKFGEAVRRVTVLDYMEFDGFLAVLANADVVLDTWPFGAGNTNYQTFSMGVPVVTLPGRYLRGRGTLAHYQHMGFEDCIADTSEDYADIAVRLGTDAEWRRAIGQKIQTRADAVLDDAVAARAFVDFMGSISG